MKSNCFNACTSGNVMVNMFVIQAVYHIIVSLFFTPTFPIQFKTQFCLSSLSDFPGRISRAVVVNFLDLVPQAKTMLPI